MPDPTPGPLQLPVPSGWYSLGFDDELPLDTVVTRRLAGHELVVVRRADGVSVLDAWCPHLGAHLGVGGRLEGDALRCPFHGFRFDLDDGRCVSTPYGGKAPPAARLRTWRARAVHGLVLCWYGAAGEDPSWEVPEWSRRGWSAWRHHRFELRGHPQEVAENAADMGHFGVVHGYESVEATGPMTTDGPLLHASYVFGRPSGGVVGSASSRVTMTIHQWGLGHALVEAEVQPMGLRTRHLVLSLPVEPDRLHLRIGVSVAWPGRSRDLHPLLAPVPRRWLAEAIAALGIRRYAGEVAQDVPIWEHKAWLPRPALAQGDGPIAAYRRWASQFAPQDYGPTSGTSAVRSGG
ncbi:MAG: Rieske (2Fe-2S) protein [Alphaproteobacteria bacterium]|nr:Rieske (2Fe-2S) protein [Alphaproteobacteria bacterium]